MSADTPLVTLEVLRTVPCPDQKSDVPLPYLYIARGFSVKAAASLKALVHNLGLCQNYNVVVPIYTDEMRARQSDALKLKPSNPAGSKLLEQAAYRECAIQLCDQLEVLAVTHSITRMTFVALSAGASIVMCLVPMIQGFRVNALHLFAPDPLATDATKISRKTPAHLYWQRDDPMIPLTPNGAIVANWLGDSLVDCTIVDGNAHEFDTSCLIAALL